MKKFLYIIIFILGVSIDIYSQNANIDSLKNILTLSKNDTSKAIILTKLSREFLNIGLFDSTIFYSNKSIAYCKKQINNSKKDIQKRYLKTIADSYNNIGIVYAQQAKFPSALDMWQKALKIDEYINNKQGIAARNGNIGNIYWNLKDNNKALIYFFKALKLSREINDENLISKWLGNIANVYREQHNLTSNVVEKKLLFDKALVYYNNALAIHTKNNNLLGIAQIEGNMGNIYLDIAIDSLTSNDDKLLYINKAKENLTKSLKLNIKINNIYDESIQLGNIGYLYLALNDYNNAEKYLKEAIKLFVQLNSTEYQRNFEEKLSYLYKLKKDYKSAYEHYVIFKNLSDKIYNSDKNNELVQKEMNYEFEKKENSLKAEQEKKNALNKAEKRKQQLIIYFILGGFVIVIIFSAFILNLFIQKRKANTLLSKQNAEINQQKEEISAQRDEIESQRDVVTKQKEHIEQIHKEVTDSINYASMLQNAILPNESEWFKSFPNSFIIYQPKDIVAGDFYWYEKINDTAIVAVADCTGHGVPGAMVSLVCSNYLNKVVNEYRTNDPGKILDQTKELVVSHFSRSNNELKDGMDISLCLINYCDNKVKIKWAGANNPIYIISKNIIENSDTPIMSEFYTLSEIKADKQPVGKTDINKPFKTHSFELNKGDSIYLFSDGYKDQFGGSEGKKFKSAKFKELILSVQGTSINNQKETISKHFNDWKGNLEQIDDICVIGIVL